MRRLGEILREILPSEVGVVTAGMRSEVKSVVHESLDEIETAVEMHETMITEVDDVVCWIDINRRDNG